MITVDTASNKVVFDISPGDIGTRLIIRFEPGIIFAYEPAAAEKAPSAATVPLIDQYRRIVSGFVKYLPGSSQAGRTA